MAVNNFDFDSIVYDSRKAKPGSAFFCLRGLNSDGHDFAKSAYKNGARVFYCEQKLDLPDDATQIVVPNTRKALSELSREFFDFPDKKLKIIGITGTKGKTSISNILYKIFNKYGLKAGLIGTNGISIDGKNYPTSNTTPESYVLFESFKRMTDCGTKYCIMEVSSQAYKTGRVEGIEFDCAAFTNLSPDHIGIGEHESFEDYSYCKSLLFKNCLNAIINIDDENADFMINANNGKLTTYSIDNISDYRAENINKWKSDSCLGVEFNLSNRKFRLSTPGKYSVYNFLCVLAICKIYNIDFDFISKISSDIKVDGRFEIVDVKPGRTFIIDYAHNELSLDNVLYTIKSYNPKRLICLFGSVGDRTQLRRAKMAKVASKYCDFIIVTSDNPGCESPENIMKDIVSGIENNTPYVTIADREEAIIYAVKNSHKGDVILLAGKGHENYQLIGREKVPFSEREILLKLKTE